MIGDRIKEARLALGYSAEQVAAFLGVSPATIYRYENGDISKLPSKFIKPLAEYLCVTPSHLMGWNDSDQNELEKNFLKYARMCMEDHDSQELIDIYQSLSHTGKVRLMQSAREYRLLYGKKSESNSAESV